MNKLAQNQLDIFLVNIETAENDTSYILFLNKTLIYSFVKIKIYL